MDNKQFKKLIDEIARKNKFEAAFGGWFKESEECIVVLDLQKSNFGNYYYLNIKIFVQGLFKNKYTKNKELVKKDGGDIFRRQPKEFDNLFDLEITMDDELRKQQLEGLFNTFIDPFSEKVLTKAGIKELADNNRVYLLPAVKEELGF